MIRQKKKAKRSLVWMMGIWLMIIPAQSLAAGLTLSKAVETALSSNPTLQASSFGIPFGPGKNNTGPVRRNAPGDPARTIQPHHKSHVGIWNKAEPGIHFFPGF